MLGNHFEIGLSLVLLGGLWAGHRTLTADAPVAALAPHSGATAELAALEDAFAHDPSDPEVVRELSDTYLELGQPALTIAVLRGASADLLEDPVLAHRLARAYEQSGRLNDAIATASVAMARCARAVGSSHALPTAPPRHSCTAGALIQLEMYREALARMVQWGVTDPASDSRARLAHQLSRRTVGLAAAE